MALFVEHNSTKSSKIIHLEGFSLHIACISQLSTSQLSTKKGPNFSICNRCGQNYKSKLHALVSYELSLEVSKLSSLKVKLNTHLQCLWYIGLLYIYIL